MKKNAALLRAPSPALSTAPARTPSPVRIPSPVRTPASAPAPARTPSPALALALALVLGIAMLIAGSAYASPAGWGSEISIYINSVYLEMDVPPMLINDRVMVPLRAVSEGMGRLVDWIDETQQVYVYMDDDANIPQIVLTIGDNVATVSRYAKSGLVDEQVKIDSPPVIINDRTLVPLRFIAEATGSTVDWNGDLNTVSIFNAVAKPGKFLAKVFYDPATSGTGGKGAVSFDFIRAFMIGPDEPEAAKRFGLEGSSFDDDYEIVYPYDAHPGDPGYDTYRATAKTKFSVVYDENGEMYMRDNDVGLSGFIDYIMREPYRQKSGVLAVVTVDGADIVSIVERYTP